MVELISRLVGTYAEVVVPSHSRHRPYVVAATLRETFTRPSPVRTNQNHSRVELARYNTVGNIYMRVCVYIRWESFPAATYEIRYGRLLNRTNRSVILSIRTRFPEPFLFINTVRRRN